MAWAAGLEAPSRQDVAAIAQPCRCPLQAERAWRRRPLRRAIPYALMRRINLIALACLLACGAYPAGAVADSDEEVRAQIIDLQIDPPMLYPTALPTRLSGTDATLDLDSGVSVYWDRGAAENGYRVGGMGLARRDRSALARDLRQSRRRGYRPRRTRIEDRRVWRICGHVCGYAWVENRRTYSLYGIYYIGDEDGQTLDRDMRYVVRHLEQLA